jgi:hypothetical protein
MIADPAEPQAIELLTHEQVLAELEAERVRTEVSTRRLVAFHAQMNRAVNGPAVRLVHSREYDVQGEGEV